MASTPYRTGFAARPHQTVRGGTPSWDFLSMCLAGVILTYAWRFQDIFSVVRVLEVTTLVSLGAMASFFLGSDQSRTLAKVKHPITTTLLVIFVLAVLSIPMGLYPGRSFGFVTGDLLKSLVIFLILGSSIRTLGELKRFLWVLLVGAAVYCLMVNLRFSVGPGGRLNDLFYYDSNDLAFALVTTLPLGVFFLLRGRSRLIRFGALGILALMFLTITKTGSRGGFLGLLAVAGFLLFLLREVPVRVRMGVVVVGVIGMTVFAGKEYWDSMATLLHPTEDYNWSGQSETGRMDVWKRGIGYMLSNPFLGVGARNFQIAEGSAGLSDLAAASQQVGQGWKWSAAHNSFVQIGAELGVFGLLAFCLGLFRAFKTSFGGSQERVTGEADDSVEEYRLLGQILATSVIGYSVAGFFVSQAFSALLYVLLALIVAYARLRPEGGSAQPVVRERRRVLGADTRRHTFPVPEGAARSRFPIQPAGR